jgi:hypothetical protein
VSSLAQACPGRRGRGQDRPRAGGNGHAVAPVAGATSNRGAIASLVVAVGRRAAHAIARHLVERALRRAGLDRDEKPSS